MTKAFLTIDDSPSPHTDRLTDFLVSRGIPAMLFCRGDLTEQNPEPVVRAIQKGFVVANHTYAHNPSGSLSFEEWTEDFGRAERVIDSVYARAGIARPGPYYRFSYLDRGDGDRIERRFPALIKSVGDGKRPDISEPASVRRIQGYLKERGFRQPFGAIDHPLYKIPLVKDAADCFFTYSAGDWMLGPRHAGNNHSYKNVDDLKHAFDADPWIKNVAGPHIILMHDHDGLENVFPQMVDYMIDQGLEFQELPG